MVKEDNRSRIDGFLRAGEIMPQRLRIRIVGHIKTVELLQLQQILIDEAAVLVDGYYNSCIVYNNEKVGYAHIYPIDYYWITDEIKPAGAK